MYYDKYKKECETQLCNAKEKLLRIDEAMSSLQINPKDNVNIKIMGLDVTIDNNLAVQILEDELLNTLQNKFYLEKAMELMNDDTNRSEVI